MAGGIHTQNEKQSSCCWQDAQSSGNTRVTCLPRGGINQGLAPPTYLDNPQKSPPHRKPALLLVLLC